MFTLPALLYLKLLPLFGQYLYHLIVPNKSRPPHAGGAALSPLVLYRPDTLLGQAGPVWVFLHHTSGRIFGLLCMIWCATGPIHDGSSLESGFETGNPPAPRPRLYFSKNSLTHSLRYTN
ncbi:hypothetical protein AVEN_150389-1 [Araneus ventricosus]|uniref:Uncharacterized protein n=1 Tax=Araneus ventricosus TaxID=182803 RepID=A0A4Y2Q0C4_ARAVE|nr:hypothetical protein AVEN_268827-1 [Araneus ventricosus]GBN56940.1 hypothetical protein AVEN_10828-1 [Araneus ventricosus]GBN56950.1 hypothetical protein AVEN_81281-1 [Araneus ventricosus]GBN56962.1 hypothetical protein AVEN_150389-1 [Araneus ventricosus]